MLCRPSQVTFKSLLLMVLMFSFYGMHTEEGIGQLMIDYILPLFLVVKVCFWLVTSIVGKKELLFSPLT